MKSIFEEIYFDNESISEKMKYSEEYYRIRENHYNLYKELESGFNDKQKELLDDLFLETGGMEGEACLSAFKEGFKTAVLMIWEILHSLDPN